MQYPSAYIALFAATAVLSLPLNINMGAYSPALVVGDGAIGFEGATGTNQVANLMNTLQGAATTSAANNGAAAPAVSNYPFMMLSEAHSLCLSGRCPCWNSSCNYPTGTASRTSC